jgi:hypothetical protein
MYQLSDEDEFGNSSRGRSLDFSYSYHERSKSEPPAKTILTELVRPHSPVVIYGRHRDSERRLRSSRSPSCRRIQSLKSNKSMELSSYQNKLARAQSLGRTERAKEKLYGLYRSKSLNVLNYEKHLPICGHKKSERFKDLNEFYSCLERIGQLECATSNSDLRPRRKNEEIIDYDLWQKVREYEKNEKELNILLKKLRDEQREKDFLFQPHPADELRWHKETDLGLITKEKSVEDLRLLFKKKAEENEMKNEFEMTKDNYKPLWRASSVIDLASNMTQKYSTANTLPKSTERVEAKYGLSKKLLSTLSPDQLNKIKNQLTEIYSNNPNEDKESSPELEKYVVTVPRKDSSEKSGERPFLTVRSHSELTKEQIQEPVIDISTLKNVFETKDKDHEKPPKKEVQQISESEKKSISQTLCQEIRDKFLQQQQQKSKPDLGHVKKALHDNVISKTLPLPKKNKKDISFSFNEGKSASSKYLDDCIIKKKAASLPDTESISSETSNRTVIFRDCGGDDIKNKIKFFEERQLDETTPTTIYHAREDSSPDEEEVLKAVEDKVKIRHRSQSPPGSPMKSPRLGSSQSFTDLKEYFGERSSMKSSSYKDSSENVIVSESQPKMRSLENPPRYIFRSRSTSPESEKCMKSLTEFGDVSTIKHKFESHVNTDDDDAPNFCHILSDSELNKAAERRRRIKKIRIKEHEYGDVSRITYKYELQSARERNRSRRLRVISPIPKHPLKKDDRFMPHINVISKTASLKDHYQRISTSNKDNLDKIEPLLQTTTGEVAKIKHKFETQNNLSIIGKMYTSAPDIRELNDISAHLSGNWIAHKFPKPQDNNRSLSSPDKSPGGTIVRKRTGDVKQKKKRHRASSTSPLRSKQSTSIAEKFNDIFKDQKYDPDIHRPRYRYLPDKQLETEYLWKKIEQRQQTKLKSNTVSFKGY